jgi:hypothetical protein
MAKKYSVTYSDTSKYVWFRTAKVASRSMLYYLYNHTEITRGIPPPKSSVREDYGYNVSFPRGQWDDYYKFAFVRNPWDRLVSCWADKIKTQEKLLGIDRKLSLELSDVSTFGNFVRKVVARINLRECDSHFKLQRRMIPYKRLDFIGRFENLQEDFEIVYNHIGVPCSLPHYNKSEHKHYTKYYDDETQAIVADRYSSDTEIFGYEFGD